WQYEQPEDTTASLRELVLSAQSGGIDLNDFILQYEGISEKLVEDGALSTRDRIYRLLDGLSKGDRGKAWIFMAKKKWKLSTQDAVNTTPPNFNELRDFLLEMATAAQSEMMYSHERELETSEAVPAITTGTATMMVSPVVATTLTPAPVP